MKVLKRNWQSKSGIQEELYLGYNEKNKLDCVADLKVAKVMTEEECEDFKSALINSKEWIIVDSIPEDLPQEEQEPKQEQPPEQFEENDNGKND